MDENLQGAEMTQRQWCHQKLEIWSALYNVHVACWVRGGLFQHLRGSEQPGWSLQALSAVCTAYVCFEKSGSSDSALFQELPSSCLFPKLKELPCRTECSSSPLEHPVT